MEDQDTKQRLISYLLGGLETEERRHIEGEYFDDDEFFREMLILEDELIDKYVDGELSDEFAERFREHYLTTPERRRHVEFARSLRAGLRAGAPPRRWRPNKETLILWASAILRPLREQYRAMLWGVIPSLTLLTAGWLLLASEGRRLRNEATWLSQQKQENDQLNTELERDLKRLEQDRSRLQSLAAIPTADASITVKVLFPMLMRSSQEIQRLLVPPRATLLLLRAAIDSPEDRTYQATLTRDGVEILQLSHLSPRSTKQGNFVEVPLTLSMLNGRSYSLTIKPEAGEEDIDTYLFGIQR